MEILKKGKDLKEVSRKRCTCSRCCCEFIYDKSDIQSDPRDGDYIICPNKTCGLYINVDPILYRQRIS